MWGYGYNMMGWGCLIGAAEKSHGGSAVGRGCRSDSAPDSG